MSQIKRLLDSLSLRQKISIGIAVAVAAALIFALLHWRRESDFKPLYSGLAPEDASAVMQKLKESSVEYRLSDNGRTILVPSERVSETRLTMAGAGLPKTGRLGFELFDRTNFGITDFAEQINYRRALEGELERTVMSLSEVEQARVHITFPKESVFLESRQPAKASVVLRLRTSQIQPSSVAAITHLVSSAVEGLAPDAVSVVDMRGTLLSRPRKPLTGGPENSDAFLEYRRDVERHYLAKINDALEPLLGADRFRAGLSVECDFSAGEQSEETFDPTRSVMVVSSKSEDVSGSSGSGPGGAAGGLPGTASNLPRPSNAQAGGGNSQSRKTENTTYQSSRVVRRTSIPLGGVKRMSVAVLLDQEVRWEGQGSKARRVLIPPTPEKLKVIRDLVAGVTGFNEQRGDQITVETLPFEQTLHSEPPAAAPRAPVSSGSVLTLDLESIRKLPGLVVAGAVAFALGLVLTVWKLFGMFFGKKKRKTDFKVVASTTPALPQGSEPGTAAAPGSTAAALRQVSVPESNIKEAIEARLSEQVELQQRLEQEALASLTIPGAIETQKTEVLAKHLREQVNKDTRSAAMILRAWMNEE